jgi:uncharacterized protein YyaL (SSP411 family)
MSRASRAALVLAVVVGGGAALVVSRMRAPTPARDPTEPPRTRHLNADGTPTYTNRLARERSPYLRQHAHNPVDWYPWGDDAFAKARTEQKPILLSVGYSTCHWCHVMEEESFEDDEIAAYLNAHYVAIKVDREERPDVDAVYMNAVQLMTQGGGGWPMTVWLTPERRPFYAGTYFPPRAGARGQRFGFLELLTRLADVYAKDPTQVETAAADVVGRLEAAATSEADATAPGPELLTRAYAQIAPTFDAEHGGFGARPKFPRPAQLLFLLRHHHRSGDPAALDLVVRTLDAMAAGGIHDHVGGGFHRYAVDDAWRVPHFEKMLYDNALLAVAYLEAAQASGRTDLAEVARTTLAYLAQEMRSPAGGFFAASDADSEGEEGKYFRWTKAELADALGAERAHLAAAYFDVGDAPTTLATPRPLDAVARELGIAADTAAHEIEEIRVGLLAARRRRVPPHVDRKAIVGWNGLAVSAFARGAMVLRDPALAEVARDVASTMVAQLHDGHLPRYLLDGTPHGQAYLDDYAFLTAGLLDLYEATFDRFWLRRAIALEDVVARRFTDPRGGAFLTADDQEALLTREKPDYDGAEPAGNSVLLLDLLRLYELTADERYRTRATALIAAFGTTLARQPTALPYMLMGVDFLEGPVKEVVLVSPSGTKALGPFLDVLARTFVPNRVLAACDGRSRADDEALVPLVAEKTAIDGKTTAYVCEHRTCRLPTTDPEELARQLSIRSTPAS